MSISPPLQIFRLQIATAIQDLWAIAIAPDQVRIDMGERHYAAHFSSAIAIAIAPQLHLEPLSIAEQITQASQNRQIQAVGKGWLNLTLEEGFILEALQELELWHPDYMVKQGDFWSRQRGVCGFQAIEYEYAYARCCALLRLAQREKIDFIDDQDQDLTQAIAFPLDVIDIAELELCLEILAIADDVLTNHQNLRPTKYQQFRKKLSTRFLQFYDRCRIFGVSSAIARRRLQLIKITQKLFLAIAPDGVDYAKHL